MNESEEEGVKLDGTKISPTMMKPPLSTIEEMHTCDISSSKGPSDDSEVHIKPLPLDIPQALKSTPNFLEERSDDSPISPQLDEDSFYHLADKDLTNEKLRLALIGILSEFRAFK